MITESKLQQIQDFTEWCSKNNLGKAVMIDISYWCSSSNKTRIEFTLYIGDMLNKKFDSVENLISSLDSLKHALLTLQELNL